MRLLQKGNICKVPYQTALTPEAAFLVQYYDEQHKKEDYPGWASQAMVFGRICAKSAAHCFKKFPMQKII